MDSKTTSETDLDALYREVIRLTSEKDNVETHLLSVDERTVSCHGDLSGLEQDHIIALRRGDRVAVEDVAKRIDALKRTASDLDAERITTSKLRDQIVGEITAAKMQANSALGKRASEITQTLASLVRGDKQIQKLLADIFLAEACAMDRDVHPQGMTGHVVWSGAIESIFTVPDADLIEEREPAFRMEYGIPKLASIGGHSA